MADHKLPEKQWAQVIEKTGGPVEYKGPAPSTSFMPRVIIVLAKHQQRFPYRSPGQTRFL